MVSFMYFSKKISLTVVAFALIVLVPQVAFSRLVFDATFQAAYPNSETYDNAVTAGGSCIICHVSASGGGAYTSYGWVLKQELENSVLTIEEAFANVNGLNSDNDSGGSSNITEIIAGSQPGWNNNGTNLAYNFDGTTEPVSPPVSLLPLDPSSSTCTDVDGDGFAIDGGTCGVIDCNDGDGAVNPNATEVCYDGIDNNCDGYISFCDPLGDFSVSITAPRKVRECSSKSKEIRMTVTNKTANTETAIVDFTKDGQVLGNYVVTLNGGSSANMIYLYTPASGDAPSVTWGVSVPTDDDPTDDSATAVTKVTSCSGGKK